MNRPSPRLRTVLVTAGALALAALAHAPAASARVRVLSPADGAAVPAGRTVPVRLAVRDVGELRVSVDQHDITGRLRGAGRRRTAVLEGGAARPGVHWIVVRWRPSEGRRTRVLSHRFIVARRHRRLAAKLAPSRAVHSTSGVARLRLAMRRDAGLMRAWVNGRSVRLPRAGRRWPTTTLVLGARHGLRFGRNRVRVLVHDFGRTRYDVETWTVNVGRERPLAGGLGVFRGQAGRALRLDGRGARPTRPGTPLSWRWRVVDKPRGAHARLRGATTAGPRLRVDRRGHYRVRQSIREGARTTSHVVSVVAEPPQPDPLRRPARYAVAAAHDLFVSTAEGPRTSGNGWATPAAGLDSLAGRSEYVPESVETLANPQYPTVAGRFRDPLTDRVLRFRMLGDGAPRFVLDSPNRLVEPDWRTGGEPGGALPEWSIPVPTNRADNPFALAAGDLDRALIDETNFDDEAVVAFMGADHRLDVRMIDYNAGGAAVTRAQGRLPVIGAARGAAWLPGSLDLAVGDFDSDSENEVAAVWQDAAGFHATFLRYRDDGGEPSLEVVAPDVLLPTGEKAPTPLGGYADVAVGDFSGEGADEIALGYAVGTSFLAPAVAAYRFDAGLRLRASATIVLDADVKNPQLPSATMTSRGVRIAAGFFRDNLPAGYAMSRRQIALAWPGKTPTASTTEAQTFDVAPPRDSASCAVCDLAITPLTSPLTVAGPTLDVNQPISLAAGGFAGLPAGRIPTWAIAVGASGNVSGVGARSTIQFLQVGNDGALHPLFTGDSSPDATQYTLTPYDRTGRSLTLGAPLTFTVQALQRTSVIAQEPPKHVDWLDGEFVNVSRNPELNVRLGSDEEKSYSAKTTTKSSWGIGGSAAAKLSVTVSESLFGIEGASGKVEIGDKVARSYEEDNADYNSSSTNISQSVESTSADDDLVSGFFQTFRVYRYPILRKLTALDGSPITGPGCLSDCHGFLEIAVPGPLDEFDLVPGRSLDWYQPPHLNGNALSYPVLDGGHVPIPDLGSYQYKDDHGNWVTETKAMFNGSTTLGGAKHEVSYDFSSSEASGHDRTTTNKVTSSFDLTVGAAAEFKVGLARGEVEGSVTTTLDRDNSWGTLDTGDTDTRSASSFKLEAPQVTSQYAYRIGTAYYYAADGTTKVAHGVDLTVDAEGRTWWRRNYGGAPDPGLNLPDAIVMTQSELETFTEPKWSSLGENRQRIRGFFVLHGSNTSRPAAPGTPYTSAPVEGDDVVFEVRVRNFSLVDAVNVPVEFYAVPTDAQGLDVAGPPVKIGTQRIPRIGAQGVVAVQQPWVAALPAGEVSQSYRIFVIVDPENTLHSIHPWKDAEEPPCPAKEVVGGKAATDPMTGRPDALSCGQNKQGFGTVTVVAKPQLAGPARADLRLTSSSLRLARSGALLAGVRSTPRVAAGVPLRGLVHVAASGTSDESRHVLVYDGPPSKGRLVAATTAAGAEAEGGLNARFTWTPRRRGRHTLYAVLRGGGNARRTSDTLAVVVR